MSFAFKSATFAYMNKMQSVFGLAAVMILSASSCMNSGPDSITSKTYTISDFSSLDLEVIGEVQYEQSDSSYLIASGSSALIEALQVSDNKGALSVELKNKRAFSGSKKELVIRVGSPKLQSIDYEGVGTLHLKGPFKGDELKISSQGVGKVIIDDCHVGTFQLISKSVGTVEMKGSANETSIHSDGIGEIDASGFKSQKAEVVSKGAGNLSVYAEQSLRVSMSGIGNVKYYGDPADVKTDISGLGKITNMGSSN